MDELKKVEENEKRNKKFIAEFNTWLMNKNLSDKTIQKHINNASLYIDDYLNYYGATSMEDGISEVYMFLCDWFITKCMWATENLIKETASSIKKFYECMSEKNYVSSEDYKSLCSVIKKNMPRFIEALEEFDSDEFYDMFE